MKNIAVGQIISALANVGVIAGLIFVGMQLRQDRELAQLAGVNDAASDRKYWAELVTNNSDVWVRGANGQMLTPPEMAAFDSLASALAFQYFSDWYRSTRLPGSRPPVTFALQFAEELVRFPGLLMWWEGNREITLRRYELLGERRTATGWDEMVAASVESLKNER